jgi:DNA-binding NarL/FixJ family response regulator
VKVFSVLVIENNEFFRKSFTGILKSYMPTLAIEETGDGTEAIKKIDSKVPDIIFVDIRLPDINGLELTKAIKTKHPETKIGVFSNLDLPEYRLTASKCGADYFLDKSALSGAEVVAMIEEVVCSKA